MQDPSDQAVKKGLEHAQDQLDQVADQGANLIVDETHQARELESVKQKAFDNLAAPPQQEVLMAQDVNQPQEQEVPQKAQEVVQQEGQGQLPVQEAAVDAPNDPAVVENAEGFKSRKLNSLSQDVELKDLGVDLTAGFLPWEKQKVFKDLTEVSWLILVFNP